MTRAARPRRPRSHPRTPRPHRVSGPGALLALVTLAVSGAGWWLLVDDGSGDAHTGLAVGLGCGAFTVAALASGVWAFATRPGGIAARYDTVARLRRTDPVARRARALGWPPPGLWALPLLQLLLFAPTLPVAYHHPPGDDSIVGGLLLYALILPWFSLLLSVLVWTMVVLPLFVLGRITWLLALRRPLPDGDRFMLVLALLLLPTLLLATGLVLGADDDTSLPAAFVGAGEQSSPWLWVARGSVAVLVATLVGARRHYGRRARAAGPS